MNTDIVIASGAATASHFGISAGISGSATIIPLAPIIATGGLLCAAVAIPAAAVVTCAYLKNKKKLDVAQLEQRSGDPRFYLKSNSGKICSAELDQESQLTATRDQAQEWEFFEILKASDGRISFRASNGKYVSANQNRGGLLIANRDSIQDWELFSVEEHGHQVALRASNGRYVSRREDDHNVLFASTDKPDAWEMFSIMKTA